MWLPTTNVMNGMMSSLQAVTAKTVSYSPVGTSQRPICSPSAQSWRRQLRSSASTRSWICISSTQTSITTHKSVPNISLPVTVRRISTPWQVSDRPRKRLYWITRCPALSHTPYQDVPAKSQAHSPHIQKNQP